MPTKVAKSYRPTTLNISEYRKSVFITDTISGSFVILFSLFVMFFIGVENSSVYAIIISYLLLSAVVYFLLKTNKYTTAVYAHLIVSILLLIVAIIGFGTSYNIQIFFISISLSAFIYTANQRFNQFFFVLHILLFAGFNILSINPFFELEQNSQSEIKITMIILFIISFMYKGLLVFNLYIKTEAAAKKENLIYQALFNNTYEGIVSVHTNPVKSTHKEFPNQQLFSLFKDSNFLLSNISNYFPEKQPNGIYSSLYYETKLKTLKNTNHIEFEFTFLLKNKAQIDTKVIVVNLQDIFETITIYLFKDITEEAKNQNIIKDQLKELNKKNIRLTQYIDDSLQFENFAHLASHDLKTPIRSLFSFSQLLEKRNKQHFDNDSLAYLNFIKSAALKMSLLINGLSEYAKIATSHKIFDEIEFSPFISTIIKDINTKFSEVDIFIQYLNLPLKIKGDVRHLQVLLYNLLSNAIQSKQANSKIEVKIEYTEKESFHQFAIHDNGIGIGDDYLKDIFVIFKKLNARDDSKNTGIGLATCKKIVQLHRGEIWAKSKINEGSTFYFTLLKNL